MARPFLREPYASLERDVIDTIREGGTEYPQSHSDCQGGVRALLRKYDLKLRAVPLDREDIVEPPNRCVVCRTTLGSEVKSLGMLKVSDARSIDIYAHPGCIYFRNEYDALKTELEKASATSPLPHRDPRD